MLVRLALVLLPLSAGVALGQPAPDCRRATTSAERAICADPRLAAADAAMARAYAALLRARPAAQQTALRANQRDWSVARDGACVAAKGDALAACLMAETEARRRFLAGEGANGAVGAPPLLPNFLAESRRGRFEITVAYPQFAPPFGAAFNAAARDLTIAEKRLSAYRHPDLSPAPDVPAFYQVGYEITYLDPRLAAVTFEFGDSGGAHPNSWRSTLLFDLRRDRQLTLGDILEKPAQAVAAIAALCRRQLEAAAKRDGWELFDNPDFAAIVGQPRSWAIDKDGVTIFFDAYSVASYADGPHECRLGWAEIGRWLKPGGPLPPH